METMRTVLQAD